jgi:methionyl-tRNA formyltransferase
MKISMFLMSNKGYQVLKSVVENNFIQSVDKVIIGIDKAVINDYSSEIKELCEEHKITYYFSNEKFNINSPYALAVSWRWIINSENLKLIVLHDSLLPKYRGFAPLVNALINKEDFIGVTALFASVEYDTGPIILQRQIPVEFPIKINEAIEKICTLYSEIVISIFEKINSNVVLVSYAQKDDEATYSLWLDSEDYFINWNYSSTTIKRFIDAVGYPYQGAKCLMNDEIVVIHNATLVEDLLIENRDIGKVIFVQQNKPVVVCGQGLLKIEEAVFKNSNESILPLKKFRTRFK